MSISSLEKHTYISLFELDMDLTAVSNLIYFSIVELIRFQMDNWVLSSSLAALKHTGGIIPFKASR
jgi:hypothetical protein